MRHYLAAVFLLFITSCAQIVSPTGGPVDITPPSAVGYLPDSAATNIKPSRIAIQFNEYIQLRDVAKEFVISPSLKNIPDVTATSKTVTVRIKDTLEDNTTYIIDFGRSIADITESNSTPFRYIFSTGPTIDSLELTGKIENVLTKKPEPDFTVMLYKTFSDSAPYNLKPYYYTRTNKEGIFRFTNLKAGTYKLFSLKDANNNFIPDLEEAIAFTEDPVVIDTSTAELKLESFIEAPTKIFIRKTELPFPGKIQMVYSKDAGDVSINFPEEKKSATLIQTEYSTGKDTITLWFTNPQSDSILFIAKTAFTSDTLEKKLPTAKGRKGGEQYGIVSSEIEPQGMIYKDDITFITTAPLDSINTKLIRLKTGQKDTTVVISHDTLLNKTFTLKMKFDQDTVNRLMFLPGALTFFNGNRNDTIGYTFVKKSTDTFGTLLLTMENVTVPVIVEVMNEQGHIKGRMVTAPGKDNTLFLKNLVPGSYSARMIIDSNDNGKWDTGNYLGKTKPEKVIQLNKGLPVKAGWDLEETWKVD